MGRRSRPWVAPRPGSVATRARRCAAARRLRRRTWRAGGDGSAPRSARYPRRRRRYRISRRVDSHAKWSLRSRRIDAVLCRSLAPQTRRILCTEAGRTHDPSDPARRTSRGAWRPHRRSGRPARLGDARARRTHARRRGRARGRAARPRRAPASAAGLGALVVAHLKGSRTSLLTGTRADALLLVHLDPSRMTGAVEKAVKAWTNGEAAPPPPGARAPAVAAAAAAAATARAPPRPRQRSRPGPPRRAQASLPRRCRPPRRRLPRRRARPTRRRPGRRGPCCAARSGAGLLTEAAALRYELPAAANPARAGCEPVSREECDRVLQVAARGGRQRDGGRRPRRRADPEGPRRRQAAEPLVPLARAAVVRPRRR